MVSKLNQRNFIKPIFESIAAKVGEDACVTWIGPGGSGHYVKMVHNGIEYGDMQLICEAYHIMKSILKLSNFEMSEVFLFFKRFLILGITMNLIRISSRLRGIFLNTKKMESF